MHDAALSYDAARAGKNRVLHWGFLIKHYSIISTMVWPAYSMVLGFEEPPSLSSWAVSDVMVIATPGLLAFQHGLWVMILQFWSSSVLGSHFISLNIFDFLKCLGRARCFGQCQNCFKIQIWNLNRLTHIQFNVCGRVYAWKVKEITHNWNHDLTFYCTHNRLCVPQYKVNV